jgi:hypothetical protein
LFQESCNWKFKGNEISCSNNHVTGSSKATKPDAGVEMMVDAITKYNVNYYTINCDDDSTI